MTPLDAWIVGPARLPEFERPLAWLRSSLRTSDLATVSDAIERAQQGEAVHLIVLCQPLPGMYPAPQFEHLTALVPLARCIVLTGSWSEGETRSGVPLPGAFRVAWHQAPARIATLLQGWNNGLCSRLNLPPTATEADQLLTASEWAAASKVTSIGCLGSDPYAVQTLRRVCGRVAYETHWLNPDRLDPSLAVQALVWDFERPDQPWEESLDRIRSAYPTPPLIVLAGFPRWQQVAALQQAGVQAVLSKPWQADDLVWQLQHELAHAVAVTASE